MLLDILNVPSVTTDDQDEIKLRALCLRLHQAATDQILREEELAQKLEAMDKALVDSKEQYQKLVQECQKLRKYNQKLVMECAHASKEIEQPILELGVILGKYNGTS